MKQSEKYLLKAEERGHLADKQRAEMDLRAGQIDKLEQERAQFQHFLERYENERNELIDRARQEAEKEEAEEERQRERAMMQAALAMENNEQREAA